MTTTQAHALAVLVESRIEQLVKFRRWYRTTAGSLRKLYPDLEAADRIELRALLKIRREAKRAAYQAQVEQDRALDHYIERHGGRQGLADEIELGMI